MPLRDRRLYFLMGKHPSALFYSGCSYRLGDGIFFNGQASIRGRGRGVVWNWRGYAPRWALWDTV